MTLLGWGLGFLGMAILLLAAYGLLRLPDALSRQHAATKAGTLGLGLFLLGTGLVAWDAAWTWRLALLALILLAALPLGSHALARAALREQDGQGHVR